MTGVTRRAVVGAVVGVGLVVVGAAKLQAADPVKVQGAVYLQVVNLTTEKVEVRVNSGIGSTTNFQFVNGQGHSAPVQLAQGLGDRVVSVRQITGSGAVTLPSKVLALGKFDPADATAPVLRVVFVSGVAGFDIVYQTAAKSGDAGEVIRSKESAKVVDLSVEQKKAVGDILKRSADTSGGS